MRVDEAKVEALIEEAVVDAHDEDERRMGFLTMLQETRKTIAARIAVRARDEAPERENGRNLVKTCVGSARWPVPHHPRGRVVPDRRRRRTRAQADFATAQRGGVDEARRRA
jgi:hypothetical protein